MSGVECVLSAESVHVPVGSDRVIDREEREQSYGDALKDQARKGDGVTGVWRLSLVGCGRSRSSAGGLQQDGDDIARDEDARV